MTLASSEIRSGGRVIDQDGREVVNVPNGIADTLQAGGSVAAPGAAASLATIVAPTPGVYDVTVTIALTGTAETALQNIKLKQNSIQVGGSLPSLSGVVTTLRYPRLTVAGGNILAQAAAASAAGSIYNVVLVATQVA